MRDDAFEVRQIPWRERKIFMAGEAPGFGRCTFVLTPHHFAWCPGWSYFPDTYYVIPLRWIVRVEFHTYHWAAQKDMRIEYLSPEGGDKLFVAQVMGPWPWVREFERKGIVVSGVETLRLDSFAGIIQNYGIFLWGMTLLVTGGLFWFIVAFVLPLSPRAVGISFVVLSASLIVLGPLPALWGAWVASRQRSQERDNV